MMLTEQLATTTLRGRIHCNGSNGWDDDSLSDVKIMRISNCLLIGFVDLSPFGLRPIKRFSQLA
jgi:hypothetical protein